MAEVGSDDRERRADRLARALRDVGLEVISAGSGQTPERVAAVVLQEDADAVGLVATDPVSAGTAVAEVLAAHGLTDVVVFGGGLPGWPEADPDASARRLADLLDARDPAPVE